MSLVESEECETQQFDTLTGNSEMHMRNTHPSSDEIELLLENARLRDALEPFLDESVARINVAAMPTRMENEFLASMLAWEQAPVLPISRWFSPDLTLPLPELLDDQALYKKLWETIHKLYDQKIILEFTDHLTDRALYCLIYRDILPSEEKKIDQPRNYLHWHCIDAVEDEQIWLQYYATELERNDWQQENGELPAATRPPYMRKMPRRPM